MKTLSKYVSIFATVLSLSVVSYKDAMALENCELPLFYFNEAVVFMIRSDQESAEKHFAIGQHIHNTLLSECNTASYSKAYNAYMEQYIHAIEGLEINNE